jgi:hypothetical protein
VGESPSKTALSFRLGVGPNVAPGIYPLTLANLAGSLPFTIEVIPDAGQQSGFYTIPTVGVLAIDGIFRKLTLRANQTSLVARTFTVSINQPAIASVSSTQVTLPAGAYEVAIMVKGLTVGSTGLLVADGGLVTPLEVPIEVVSGALPSQNAVTASVGVFRGSPFSSAGSYVSAPVGVVKGSLFGTSAFTVSPVVMALKGSQWWAGNGTWISPTVGIVRTAN